MPPKFRKKMAINLHYTKNIFIIINYRLLVTKGREEDHIKTVEEIKDKAEIRLKTEKLKIAKGETNWLG